MEFLDTLKMTQISKKINLFNLILKKRLDFFILILTVLTDLVLDLVNVFKSAKVIRLGRLIKIAKVF